MDEDEIILSSNLNSFGDVAGNSLERLLCIEYVNSLMFKSGTINNMQLCKMTETETTIGDTIREQVDKIIDRGWSSNNSLQLFRSGSENNSDEDQSQHSYSLLTAQDIEGECKKNNKVENTVNQTEHANMNGPFVGRSTQSPSFSMPLLAVPLSTMNHYNDQLTPPTPKLSPAGNQLATNQVYPVSSEVLVNRYTPENILLNCLSEIRHKGTKEIDKKDSKNKCNIKIDLNNSMKDLLTFSMEETSMYDQILDRINLNEKPKIFRHEDYIPENTNNRIQYSECSTQENTNIEISKEANVDVICHEINLENYNGQMGLSSPEISAPICNSYLTKVVVKECAMKFIKDQDMDMIMTCSHNGSTQNIVEVNSLESMQAKDQIVIIETDSENEEIEIKKQKLNAQNEESSRETKHLKNKSSTDRIDIGTSNVVDRRPYDQKSNEPFQQKVSNQPRNTLGKYLEVAKEGFDSDPYMKNKKSIFTTKPILKSKTKFKNMEQLLLLGIILPGVDVLSCSPGDKKKEATLLADGNIVYENKIYDTLMAWYRSVSGQKRVKLGSLLEEVLYKKMSIKFWIYEYDRNKKRQGTKKEICHIITSRDKEPNEQVSERIGGASTFPTITSVKSKLITPIKNQSDINNPSLAISNDLNLMTSNKAQTSEFASKPPCNEDPNWPELFTHVRLLTNEELFPFSQEEWDSSHDDPDLLESLINWV